MVVFATIAVALVTLGAMIIVAKGLLRRADEVDERPSQAGSLIVSLLPDCEDGGPLTPRARLFIVLLTEEVGGPQT